MEAINNSENGPVSRAYAKADNSVPKPPVSASKPDTNVNIADIGSLAERASQTADDVRPDAVERARALLADPNWPNDEALEGLAAKLLRTEEFS
tara:strand:+ start:346 stop:627 length:282 start_codon:yes stop_codon:yes gene_type:complete